MTKVLALTALLPFAAVAAGPDSCARLAAMKLANGPVTSAQSVPAGAYQPAATGGGRGQGDLWKALPAFCRVALTMMPSSDSDIKVEVWLPSSNWNGKLQAVGNGGWTGSIDYNALGRALAKGYAAASTDTGHQGSRADFAIGHPEKMIDFAFRAVHEMTVESKLVVAAFYGGQPKYSYFNGCSSGGKQALKEAQLFPADFDGIIAGSSANNWVHQKAAIVNVSKTVHQDAAHDIPESKYPLLHKAALDACDAIDGVRDGVIEEPERCKIDLSKLECKGPDSPSCFTSAQLDSVRKIYAPTRKSTGEFVFPGLEPGSELGWGVQACKDPRQVAYDLFAYVVYKDPNWDYMTIDLDKDVALGDASEGGMMAATNPNLKPYFSHNGKLLMYHGWADTNIDPLNSVNYFSSVLDFMGRQSKQQDSIRLFMVPGMGHCGGGEGPNDFDMVSALEKWVENGTTPTRIVAAKKVNGATVRTRPLCPYPQAAVYKETGTTDDEANFSCAVTH
jgi:feruloyl esterase